MAIARNHQLFITEPTYFHLISRCVRRAYLCGKDKYSGKRFDHRKRWLEKRILELSNVFFIDVYGYAVMSNHYHLVVRTCPEEMVLASDEQIAKRWSQLFPRQNESTALRIKALCQEKPRLGEYRLRLCDISWVMRSLNEGLARMANKEDGCKGRFWQGRFRSQLLLDESAVYTCMAYVDLNPVRAGIASKPEESKFTSIRYRIKHHCIDDKLRPLSGRHEACKHKGLNLVLSDYLILVDEAGRCLADGKSGHILGNAQSILTRMCIRPPGFMQVMDGLSTVFSRGIGSVDNLINLSEKLDLSWVKGHSIARRVFR